ncbi:bifunctional uroporphyrinogen-III C-methyltransferase/uroporphyrinogen-III synthase [Tsukamurella soli]
MPGRITFIGSGPGDPGLLTLRAQQTIVTARTVYTDPDVPVGVLDLVGTELEPEAVADGAEQAVTKDAAARDDAARVADKPKPGVKGPALVNPARVIPALGEPAEVAKALLTQARHGYDVVRLVAGDPMASEAVLAEVQAVSRTQIAFEIVPGLSPLAAVPTYAGMALGGAHTQADVRGEVDWAALAAAPGPLVLSAAAEYLADTAAALIAHALPASTPVAITSSGSTCKQKTVEATLGTLDEAGVALPGPLVVTVGKVVTHRTRLSWWESRALYGWTVLVPRTKDQAAEMSGRLRGHGAIPMEVPTIAVEPPRSPAQMERAVKGLVDGRYQWVVFTSTNAVRAVWEKFTEFGLDARAFSGVKIACVGQSTAEKVRGFGIEPELVPSGEQSSLGLLDDFPPFDDVFDPVNRVLLPRADIATETLAEGLRDRGWEIDDVTAYRTVRAAPPPASTREMIKTGEFDAVCFTSSSTVRNLVGIAGKPHTRTIVACIGPKTAETAIEFGLRVDVQPETASVEDLVEALAAHASRLRAEGALPPPRKKPRRSRS